MATENQTLTKAKNITPESVWKRTRAIWVSGVVALNTALGIWVYLSSVLQWSLWLYFGIGILTLVGIYLVIYVVSLKKRVEFLDESNQELRDRVEDAKTALERERDRGLEHGIIRAGGLTYLILEADTRKGALLYEERRNVLFDYATVQLIMSEVLQQAGEQGLRKIGREVGRNFATGSFPRFLASKSRSENIREKDKIGLWVDYDRDAGFGRFDDSTFFDDRTGKYQGFVELHESFLTEGRVAESDNLCAFMEGYIEGVLNVIVARNLETIRVEHVRCGCSDILPEVGCSFEIKYPESAPEKLPESSDEQPTESRQ